MNEEVTKTVGNIPDYPPEMDLSSTTDSRSLAESAFSQMKHKKRGFVMTGGGAKGLYEAGVIHAFHITGMEFDIITGSSIGAMNSVFFAEYQYHKKQLSAEIRQDPEKVVEAMDDLVKAFHHAWLMMPEKHIIDDSETGPIGKLKNDLLEFDLSLPQIVSLLWWWTDPNRSAVPSPRVWPAMLKLGRELVERLGGANKLLGIIKSGGNSRIQLAIRTYLQRFGMDRSLIPAGEGDNVLRDVFTDPISPLRKEHLQPASTSVSNMWTPADDHAQKYRLVEPERTLRDYAEEGITVRLTRANYRTGRLEISTYMDPEDFIRYMDKQAWRVEVSDLHTLPLGSFRLQMPGNPNALNAAIASGRFPGVFAPFPVTEIYPVEDQNNRLLYEMMESWLDSPETAQSLAGAYQDLQSHTTERLKSWDSLVARWQNAKNMHSIFPRTTDAYVDGGAIDNTPANSAIDAAREWLDSVSISKRDALLELFVVFLHSEPRIDFVEAQDPNFFEVVTRTLDIQGAAKLSSEDVTLDTINRFGARGETLGRAVQILLNSFNETLSSLTDEQKLELETKIQNHARVMKQRGYIGRDASGILGRMENWAEEMIGSLPLHVDTVNIYPEQMPLSTLQFTERLGYRQENAIDMLTMGCYNTIWALRTYFEERKNDLDEQDHKVLTQAQKWMGDVELPRLNSPENYEKLQEIKSSWKCSRTECVFHQDHCLHGEVSS